MIENPIEYLKSKKIKKDSQYLGKLYRAIREKYGEMKFDVDIFEKYSTKIRNRNQFKPNVINEIGKMFTFSYRPLNYDTLPYYDMQPLIFSLNIPSSEEVFGINLHYLPLHYRFATYQMLVQFATDPTRKANTRIRLLYDYMKNKKQFIPSLVSIRQYKTKRIRSMVYEIDPKYWEHAIIIPTQLFIKKNEKTVYMNTSREIRKKLGENNG